MIWEEPWNIIEIYRHLEIQSVGFSWLKIIKTQARKVRIRIIVNGNIRKWYINCGIRSHFANKCRKPKSEVSFAYKGKEYEWIADEKNKTNQRVCLIDENHSEKNKWLLVSCASTHACNSSSLFENIKPENTKIIVGDNREGVVTGRGTVKLRKKFKNLVNTLMLNDLCSKDNTQETNIDLDVPESEKSCEECDLSKVTKLAYTDKPQSIIDEEREKCLRIGVIHSDLMGSMKSKSLGGSRYVLTYIDSNSNAFYLKANQNSFHSSKI